MVVLCVSDYAFPYIILVLSLVTLAVYMSVSKIQVKRRPAASAGFKLQAFTLNITSKPAELFTS